MIPTYPFSLSSSSFNSNSTMPIIDLNIVDDHQSHEQIFSPTHQPSYSSSSLSSSSCPILFNPSHQLPDHAGSSYLEYKNLQNDYDEAFGKNIIGSNGGSWNDPDQEKGGGAGVEIRKRGLKLKVWKRSSAASGSSEKEEEEENNHNHNHNQTEDNYDSMKWMPSKMRMMRKMMVASTDHNHNNNDKVSSSSSSEDQNQNQNQNQYRNQQRPLLLSPRGNDNSSSSNNSSTQSNTNNNNITIRVCADCHTTKTPLWRSGPRGPKSLCNACGIRQRKARRAMAAAAAAAASNGGSLDLKAAEKSAVKRSYKVHSSKENKKLKFERETIHHQIMKKKHKVEDDDDHQDKEANNNNSSGKSPSSSPSIINKFSSFEEFTVSLMSKNLATSSQVFPQDEKEAAILLMALSCNGLVHG